MTGTPGLVMSYVEIERGRSLLVVHSSIEMLAPRLTCSRRGHGRFAYARRACPLRVFLAEQDGASGGRVHGRNAALLCAARVWSSRESVHGTPREKFATVRAIFAWTDPTLLTWPTFLWPEPKQRDEARHINIPNYPRSVARHS